MGLLDRALNIGEGKQFREYEKRVSSIGAFEPELEELDDAELRERIDALREEVQSGESTLDDVLEETFAIVREAGRRTMGMRHFDVQLIGGMVLHGGNIAEMKTGEGKTLTATLAVCLNALAGKGVHVVTVNDYLARRDAEWMSPIYDLLGCAGACCRTCRRARTRSRPTPPTSPTARTPSSASTTCATTWRSRSRRRSSTAGASARTAARWRCTASRSSTRSTTS